MPKKSLPPLADERVQLIRWIGVTAAGEIYRTSKAGGSGIELSEPLHDEIPPVPSWYWNGREHAPKP